ncbi:MAG: hypothetical protein ACT4PU_06185 [Planctomycetota bacterium]
MKNAVRLLMSSFMVILIVASVLGIKWWGTDGPKPPPGDGRPILVLGIVAGVVGLWFLWKDGSSRRTAN